jgi:hypothetical protein
MSIKKLALIFVIGSMLCGNAIPSDAFVECPNFKDGENVFNSSISENSLIAIEQSQSINYPVVLATYQLASDGLCVRSKFAEYSVEGGSPVVESLFFYRLFGELNVFTIVSWSVNNRGARTYGKLYQVYAYNTGGDGRLHENEKITNDYRMTGMDGFDNGKKSSFPYKTAHDIKRALSKLGGYRNRRDR